jgi:hypothetical protein
MSRGPGRIERALRGLFDASPDRAFLTADLVKHCFPDARRIERKHEVSVLRAARKIVAGDPDWTSWRTDWGSIVYNGGNLRSYGLFEILRSEGRLIRPDGSGEWDYPPQPGRRYYDHYIWRQDPKVDRAVPLLDHPHCQAHMAPDGAWWKAVRLHCAERDGDEAAAAPLRLEAERAKAKSTAEVQSFLRQFNPGIMSVLLKALAEQLPLAAGELRELALENDPDAVRAGLTELAGKLETWAGQIS